MAFSLSIQGVKRVSPGLWTVSLEPAHVRMLAGDPQSIGPTSVLLLTTTPSFDADTHSLSFSPASVRVLNVGATDSAVIVASDAPSATRPSPKAATTPTPSTGGDVKFLARLTPELKELGQALLHAIRKQFTGELVFHPASEKFVESPDNFWTVRIQPRDRSLRVIVRGTLESLPSASRLEYKRDMGSYTAFKVSSMAQIGEAVEAIRSAAIRRK